MKAAFHSTQRFQRCTFFFHQSNGVTQILFYLSLQLSDLSCLICSKSSHRGTVTLLTPAVSSSVTSRRLGLSATLLLVGTLANYIFNWALISLIVKISHTNLLPSSEWIHVLGLLWQPHSPGRRRIGCVLTCFPRHIWQSVPAGAQVQTPDDSTPA